MPVSRLFLVGLAAAAFSSNPAFVLAVPPASGTGVQQAAAATPAR